MERIPSDSGMQFTSAEFQDKCQTRVVHLKLAALDYQEINQQVEVTWRTLHTNSHSLMLHARFSETYINFTFIYTEDPILPVLPIKYLINEDGKPTTPYQLAAGMKPSISYLLVLSCPFVVQKSTAHVWTKELNIRHQAQKGFYGISVGIPQCILFMYHTNRRSYLHTMLFFGEIFLFRWRIHQNHMQKLWL